MKKIFILSAIALLSTACSSFYQVMRVSVPDNAVVTQQEISCKSQDATLAFDFWADRGDLNFRLYNNSSETMHIFLDETFLTKNGLAADYMELSKSFDRMTKYGTCVVSIPAGAHRLFVCPRLQSEIFEYCDVELCPAGDQIQEVNFSADDSPLHFSFDITYTLGQDPTKKMLHQSFFVNQTVNYHERDFERHHDDTVRICNEEELIPVQDLRSPDKFFIKY